MTCKRQIGAQEHVMYGNTHKDRLVVFEPMHSCQHFKTYFIDINLTTTPLFLTKAPIPKHLMIPFRKSHHQIESSSYQN